MSKKNENLVSVICIITSFKYWVSKLPNSQTRMFLNLWIIGGTDLLQLAGLLYRFVIVIKAVLNSIPKYGHVRWPSSAWQLILVRKVPWKKKNEGFLRETHQPLHKTHADFPRYRLQSEKIKIKIKIIREKKESRCVLVSGECDGEAGGVSKTLSWSERRRSRSSSSRFDIVGFVNCDFGADCNIRMGGFRRILIKIWRS
jgi:hypothetical protein